MSEPMSNEAAEQPHTYAPVEPVPVSIVKDETPEKLKAATYGGWSTYQFAATDPPAQVLRFDERRRRAVLLCLRGAAGNVNGNLWLGSRAQVTNGNPALSAGLLVSGSTITIESATEIWCAPDGVNSLTLVVLDEIYRS